MKKNSPVIKDAKVGRILQVQEIIDFFVLSEIMETPRYLQELDSRMVLFFKGVGVNLSYMSRRIAFMREKGYLVQQWDDPVNRVKHYCRITDAGREYFMMMLRDIPGKIENGLSFYQSISEYTAKRYAKWDITQ